MAGSATNGLWGRSLNLTGGLIGACPPLAGLSASTVLAEAGIGGPQQRSVCRHAAKLLVSF